ncbi:MAG: aminotransferase class III-fold pyridoxal phosphate-dependent enzyme [Candidatus Marinimicrobia bacterium]|nr:aminotransferase class III-fold pyridoxal phosphate-dependent enzyme [Candidatus Neomarinimicrobiota bacterium]MBL7010301.1 aminotransferase class III-fold pyridoxal phosphate-dependent enzyme [Candidatus Neomarinimicrobiota bacterium]MBL7030556.1 aminotransferase class III-fold pyridoxal phosphate-dependent enzyme [Candidatus Neomarinimicrobiota bacterium]
MNERNYLSPVWTHLTDLTPVKGEGAYLYDADGTQYLDFTCGIGVTNTGHCHPNVIRAIQEQADKLLFGQINIVKSQPTLDLAEKLNELTPKNINQFFFSNSGAEAVEASIKLAKQTTGKSNVIVFQGSFHGRTHLAMSMTTSKTGFRQNYQPLPSGIFVSPYPYAYLFGWDEKTTSDWCMDQLDLLVKSQTAPSETAAIIIEPLLGEGGYVPAPPIFMQALRAFCDKHEILMITDEVQSGFGRTGKMFCIEHSNVEPDILIMAKGMGSGLPISAIGASSELMAKWILGTHGGTYGGGSVVPIAAANATIQTILDEKLVENAEIQGYYLLNRLYDLKKDYTAIGDNRGLGLMVGTEFTGTDGKPDPETAKAVHKACLDQNLLLLTCGTYLNVIRWIPPLIVTKKQIDDAVDIFHAALKKT